MNEATLDAIEGLVLTAGRAERAGRVGESLRQRADLADMNIHTKQDHHGLWWRLRVNAQETAVF